MCAWARDKDSYVPTSNRNHNAFPSNQKQNKRTSCPSEEWVGIIRQDIKHLKRSITYTAAYLSVSCDSLIYPTSPTSRVPTIWFPCDNRRAARLFYLFFSLLCWAIPWCGKYNSCTISWYKYSNGQPSLLLHCETSANKIIIIHAMLKYIRCYK